MLTDDEWEARKRVIAEKTGQPVQDPDPAPENPPEKQPDPEMTRLREEARQLWLALGLTE